MGTLDNLIDELSQELELKPKKKIHAGFEKQSRLEPVRDAPMRKRKKKEPERSLTVEEKLAVDAIRLRETLDPTRFYKKKATEQIGDKFHIGTVIEHPMDYYTDRATRKECKETLVDELIADAEFKKNVLRRYRTIKATDAIRKREKALAERRRAAQAKKKAKKTS